ncbi:NADH-quinone oxidoreductase subunit NuoH [Ilumatobacter nonamiensis]|uniref:NADH-quinone oxidoreductase subunit NuoH n=1 Tax=Ilumatobacter nonamiensis TaxID=467093 RepID=UPI000347F057|nr:NADH-quinone oxidoreductase subunit NuoH [Ilumatobacter nonamiensis]
MLAIDPLGTGGWLWTSLLIMIGKVLVIFVVSLVATMLMIWGERKIVSGMHNRVGPNKAGPWGIMQSLADGIKAFFKETFRPSKSDPFLYKLAPYLMFIPAFLIWAVIPLGGDFTDGKDGTVTIFGQVTRVQLADPQVGILFVLAMSSIAVYGVMLAGWASGSKYPLLGAVRGSAQMISYEAALGLSLAAVLLSSGSLSTARIVQTQDSFVDWNLVATGIVPFAIFLVATTAELNRPPFDLVEAEQELVSGFNTEYGGIAFALFFLAEFMNVITMSGVIVTLFLGGPQPIAGIDIPFIPGAIEGTIWFVLKLLVFLYVYIWLRATLPRLRYDQLMDFGWKVLIPVALGWFLLLAALRQFSPDGTFADSLRVTAICVVVGIASIALFYAALQVSRRNRERAAAPQQEGSPV